MAELFDDFKQEAFRLETLDDYGRSGNKDAYQLFLGGKPKPQGYNTGWPDEARENVDAGRRMYRVHVVTRPLREQPNPLADVGDFWLFDSVTAAPMHYTPDGEFSGADVLPHDRADEYVGYRNTALAHALPFADWWATYGE
ncbi:DUF6879 family protein [Streptomyces cyaneofuscatus]